jgi:hypothetical protein
MSASLKASTEGIIWPELPEFTWPDYVQWDWSIYDYKTWDWTAFDYRDWDWNQFDYKDWDWDDWGVPQWVQNLIDTIGNFNPFGRGTPPPAGVDPDAGPIPGYEFQSPSGTDANPYQSYGFSGGGSIQPASVSGTNVVVNASVASDIDVVALAYEVADVIKRSG